MTEGPHSAGIPKRTLVGQGAARGIAVGPAVVLERRELAIPRRRLRGEECDEEVARFEAAVVAVQASWRVTLAKVSPGRPEGALLEAYALMAGDPWLRREVEGQVRDQLRCAEWAVASAARALARRLFELDDPYLRERGHDVEFVGRELLRAIDAASRRPDDAEERESTRLREPAIVVARELSPADIAALGTTPLLGFVTAMGTRTSHTAILARALGLPAVVGVGDGLAEIQPGQALVVDGTSGRVVVDPGSTELELVEVRAAAARRLDERLRRRRDEAGRTEDGETVRLLANLERASEVERALEHGADGVGLFRTEFLFVERRTQPSEDEQLAAFRAVLSALRGRPATFRTFDLGGDKLAGSVPASREANPMLGVRAVRLQLARPDVLATHLRAMARASAFGPMRILVPLVGALEEIEQVRAAFDVAWDEVVRAGHPVGERPALGAMIEVPAAAIAADAIADAVDFLSVGTNDLVQYCLAADRGNPALAHLATPFHPAVSRLLEDVVGAARRAGKPLSLCGEMASEPLGALLLVGLGYRELSMEATAIPIVKEALARFSSAELALVVRRARSCLRTTDVLAELRSSLGPRIADLLDPRES